MAVGHVVVFEKLHHFAFATEMVGGVVGIVVSEVADQEECKKRVNKALPDNEIKPTIKQRENKNRGCRWHHQSGRVLGLVMMNAMEQKYQPLTGFALSRIVKDKSMEGVFNECPDKQPNRQPDENLRDWQSK